jgi:hypothetical protein
MYTCICVCVYMYECGCSRCIDCRRCTCSLRCTTSSNGSSPCSRSAVPCRAVPSHAVPCRAVPCHPVLCHPVPSCAVPSRAVPCRAIPCHPVPCRAVPSRAIPCRAVPCRAIPRRAVVRRAIPPLGGTAQHHYGVRRYSTAVLPPPRCAPAAPLWMRSAARATRYSPSVVASRRARFGRRAVSSASAAVSAAWPCARRGCACCVCVVADGRAPPPRAAVCSRARYVCCTACPRGCAAGRGRCMPCQCQRPRPRRSRRARVAQTDRQTDRLIR